VRRHVVLIGLPGAGKSTVGRLAAARLGAGFEDTDELVVTAAGRPIARIFADDGEAAFRKLEREAMVAALERAPRVIAAGGGWAAEPGNLEAATVRALIIHLACTPETAAGRAGGSAERPLVAGADPLPDLEALLRRRRPAYRRADVEVPTDGRLPDDVAADVVALARSHGGW
jgi:shikimate kinase